MGQKQSKKEDKLMGNERVRTIILAGLLLLWALLVVSYQIQMRDAVLVTKTQKDAYLMAAIGVFTIIASCIAAIVFRFVGVPGFLTKAVGVALIVGGALYWAHAIVIMGDRFELTKNLPDRFRTGPQAWVSILFAEELLPGMGAVLLGLDVFMSCWHDEHRRLLVNLGHLAIVSSICSCAYYAFAGVVDSTIFGGDLAGKYATFGIAYTVIFGVCIAYVVLYLFSCCTCNCKDKKFVRWIIAIGLVVGGVWVAILKYADIKQISQRETGSNATNLTFKIIGYTLYLLGLCVAWALDIAKDDN